MKESELLKRLNEHEAVLKRTADYQFTLQLLVQEAVADGYAALVAAKLTSCDTLQAYQETLAARVNARIEKLHAERKQAAAQAASIRKVQGVKRLQPVPSAPGNERES